LRPLLRGRESDDLRVANASRFGDGRREQQPPLLPAAGARVVNARGIPGSVGFLAVTRHDRRLVLVTAHHVLFGDGAREGEPVWCSHDSSSTSLRCIGHSLYGRSGPVRGDSRGVYVDCGAASVAVEETGCGSLVKHNADTDCSLAVGERVTKIGAATGFTEGEVVSTAYAARIVRDDRNDAVGQVLIRSSAGRRPFSSAGDSGAAVLNERGDVVALLWGVAPQGDSLACPIARVLYVLNVAPVCWLPNGNRDLLVSEAS